MDVDVEFDAMPPNLDAAADEWAPPHYVSPFLDAEGAPQLRAASRRDGSLHLLEYSDGTRIVVDGAGSRIWATAPSTATIEDTATYLLGPILGFVLRLRGHLCLHASAVEIDGLAVGLVGRSGSGKSSTAAAFAKLGFPILTDDVLALDESKSGHFDVLPAYPRIRLWPDSVAGLFGGAEALPRITPNWDKRFLDLNAPGYSFASGRRRLAALYFLGERTDQRMQVRELSRKQAMMELLSDTYSTHLIDKRRRAAEFPTIGRLLDAVMVRQAIPELDFGSAADLCAAIAGDFRTSNLEDRNARR